MNKVNFFGHEITKLIVGDNPFNGHSYIEDIITGSEMKGYYTAENIKKALRNLEATGYNAMLPLADPYMVRILQEYQAEGGNLKYIWQPYMPMNQDVSIRELKSLNTIGIYHQGTTTDFLYESGKIDEIKENLKKFRELGVPVGLGTHVPEVIERSEEEGWDVDFYLACMHNARKGREGEPSGFITGKTKSQLVFYPEDRPVMLETLKKIEKPIIAFKIFGGGQMFLNKTEEEKRELIKGAYNEVFTALKPNDLAAIGVFQRDNDQIKENYELYEEWYNSQEANNQ
jgi:hypothetical protein